MKNKKRQKIKLVIANPERLPEAQDKMIEFVYERYIKKVLDETANGTIENDVK